MNQSSEKEISKAGATHPLSKVQAFSRSGNISPLPMSANVPHKTRNEKVMLTGASVGASPQRAQFAREYDSISQDSIQLINPISTKTKNPRHNTAIRAPMTTTSDYTDVHVVNRSYAGQDKLPSRIYKLGHRKYS